MSPSDAPVPVSSPRTLDDPQVKELGGMGGFFTDNFGWLHWGPFGLRSAEAQYVYLKPDAPPANGTVNTLEEQSAAILRANIAFSKRLQRSRLVLQYNPRLLAVGGHVSADLLNQDAAFDLLFAPTRRLSIGVSNWFAFYGSKNPLTDKLLDQDSIIGIISNPFFNGAQRAILDTVAVPVSYSFSPRTSFSFSPFYSYARNSVAQNASISGGAPPPLLTTSMYQVGGRSQLDHIVSPNLTLGIYYTYQQIRVSTDSTGTPYHTVGGTFARRLGRSLVISGQAGASESSVSSVHSWTGVGSLTVAKSFQHGSLQVTGGRDGSFTGWMTDNYNNHGWITYQHQVSRRMTLETGLGYLSSVNRGTTLSGKYVTGNFGYSVSRNLSWFFGYVRSWQSGDGVQLLTLGQSQFQTGLRWSPGRPEY